MTTPFPPTTRWTRPVHPGITLWLRTFPSVLPVTSTSRKSLEDNEVSGTTTFFEVTGLR